MEENRPGREDANAITLNQALVDELKSKGFIRYVSTEDAFRAVFRHQFLPQRSLEEVYSNRAISAKQDAAGQWISSSSEPGIMAIMLEQLDLQPGQSVLEIGAGTGYNAALMAHIVGETGRVVTIEFDADLAEAATVHLATAGFERVQVVCGDGGYGYAAAAPFDRMILTVGAPDITPAWWDQLKPGGRLVLPLEFNGLMKSVAFERAGDPLTSLSMQDCAFMPLRGEFASGFTIPIQLGPDPGLSLELLGGFSFDADAIYDALAQPGQDLATGVEVALWDVMLGDLFTWLSMREPRLAKLVAKDSAARQNLFHPLFRVDTKQEFMGSLVLLGDNSLSALTRPPSEPVEPLPIDRLFERDVRFSLCVCQYGADDSTARRLVKDVQEWDAEGRPSFERMQIKVYRKGFDYVPSPGEKVLEKQFSKFVIQW